MNASISYSFNPLCVDGKKRKVVEGSRKMIMDRNRKENIHDGERGFDVGHDPCEKNVVTSTASLTFNAGVLSKLNSFDSGVGNEVDVSLAESDVISATLLPPLHSSTPMKTTAAALSSRSLAEGSKDGGSAPALKRGTDREISAFGTAPFCECGLRAKLSVVNEPGPNQVRGFSGRCCWVFPC